MQYIKKQVEIDTSGHTNEYWECDFKSVNLTQLPYISINMLGTKTYTDKVNGKLVSDKRNVTVTAVDLQLAGTIGYANIPKLYEVLTTKTVKEDYYTEEEVEGVLTQVMKTREVPVYPDFFGGEIVNVL